MKCTKITQNIQSEIENLVKKYEPAQAIINAIAVQGGRALLVGGAVRDLFLNVPITDMDIEVHDLALEQLEAVLSQFGEIFFVGKSFGVFHVRGLAIDWSLPRSDSIGRKPVVHLDPAMSMYDAFARRDLTINAMGIDLITYELIDPFDGLHDLRNHILRAPCPARFVEDPLRFFRVMQFISRFEMQPDEALNTLCKSMQFAGISLERIQEEFEKLFLKSRKPSLGIRWLQSIDRLAQVIPELAATIGLMQDPRWHPEGDVFEHTMQTIDALAVQEYETIQEKLILSYAGLCHDLGKVQATQKNDDHITNYGHDTIGAALVSSVLSRITRNKEIVTPVSLLVRYHMIPEQLVIQKSSLPAYKRLAHALWPTVTLEMLAKLVLADKQARNASGHEPLTIQLPTIATFITTAQKAAVINTIEKPLLQGRDLLDLFSPGPVMGKWLKRAYEMQLEEGIKDKELLKEKIQQEYVQKK